jgi:hypothetical protein
MAAISFPLIVRCGIRATTPLAEKGASCGPATMEREDFQLLRQLNKSVGASRRLN